MADFDEMDDFFGNDDLMEDPMEDDENDKVPTDAEVLNNLFEEDEKKGKTKKRIVQKPQPKLNEATLVGEKGIPSLRKMFEGFTPNKNLDPYANMAVMMKKYEHWAHLMFPKLKFDDVIARCELLGPRRAVKVYMTKSRLGMPMTDEDFAPRQTESNEVGIDFNADPDFGFEVEREPEMDALSDSSFLGDQ